MGLAVVALVACLAGAGSKRLRTHNPAALNEADVGQPMDDQTAIDVYERDKYSEDHREDRDGDGDALRDRQSNMTPP
jgi:hypothetical protein